MPGTKSPNPSTNDTQQPEVRENPSQRARQNPSSNNYSDPRYYPYGASLVYPPYPPQYQAQGYATEISQQDYAQSLNDQWMSLSSQQQRQEQQRQEQEEEQKRLDEQKQKQEQQRQKQAEEQKRLDQQEKALKERLQKLADDQRYAEALANRVLGVVSQAQQLDAELLQQQQHQTGFNNSQGSAAMSPYLGVQQNQLNVPLTANEDSFTVALLAAGQRNAANQIPHAPSKYATLFERQQGILAQYNYETTKETQQQGIQEQKNRQHEL